MKRLLEQLPSFAVQRPVAFRTGPSMRYFSNVSYLQTPLSMNYVKLQRSYGSSASSVVVFSGKHYSRMAAASYGYVRRSFSSAVITEADIEKRVMDVLCSFEKIKADKLNLDAKFTSDLSLDSLDVVEVVMALEEEFEVTIPDHIADSVKTPREAVNYLTKTLIPNYDA